jgi:hypothetical protein
MGQSEDKRRHPRISQRVRVQSLSRDAVELETIDVSVGGLRCTSPQFIPPMTKMALSMVLPSTPGHAGNGQQMVQGEAVVVRTEPATAAAQPVNGGYRVALFFSRMDDPDRKILLDWLKSRTGS